MVENALFHHIGIATSSIQATSSLYMTAGFQKTDVVFDPLQNVNVVFLQKEGCPLLELVEPIDRTSPVHNILKKVGVTAYHFCYEVEDILDTINQLEEKDFKVVVDPVDAIAFDNRKICFLYHIDIGLIELLQTTDA